MREKNEISDKSKKFAVRCIRLYKYLATSHAEYVMSKQLLRSGTSIGANVRESLYAQSKADFTTKMTIALKEASETAYWLELLFETEYINKQQFDSIYNDACEIIKMLTSIVKTSKNN